MLFFSIKLVRFKFFLLVRILRIDLFGDGGSISFFLNKILCFFCYRCIFLVLINKDVSLFFFLFIHWIDGVGYEQLCFLNLDLLRADCVYIRIEDLFNFSFGKRKKNHQDWLHKDTHLAIFRNVFTRS